MVFGGAMHPDQDGEHPWLADEADFIREAIDHEVPLFGVCLGAQLIARAVGRAASARRDGGGRLARRPPERGRPRRSGARRAAASGSTPSSGTTTASSSRTVRELLADERRRPAGLPARRAHLGRPVPPRGDAAHARLLVRRGGGRAARSRPSSAPRRIAFLGAWNEHGRRSAARSSTSPRVGERRRIEGRRATGVASPVRGHARERRRPAAHSCHEPT